MKPRLLMVGGWAHPAEALQPLAEMVAEFATPRLLAADEPIPPPDQPTVLLGWSLGGLGAVRAVLADSDRWLGLIGVSTTPRFCSAPDWPQGVAAARIRAMKAGLRQQPEDVLRKFFTEVAAPAHLASVALEEKVRTALTLDIDMLVAGLDALLNTDLRAQLARSTKPALILHGRADRIIPCAAGEWLADQFIFHRCVVLDHVGHDLPLRALDQVAEEINLYLQTLS